jgi:hypothetical protein
MALFEEIEQFNCDGFGYKVIPEVSEIVSSVFRSLFSEVNPENGAMHIVYAPPKLPAPKENTGALVTE